MAAVSQIVLIGIGATLIVDIWSLVLRLFGITSLDYRYVGRWIACFPKGQFAHRNILGVKPVYGELVIGWAAHYLIGITFAFLLVFIFGKEWIARPMLFPALFVGLITVCAPLFIMQPALGFGVASSKLPHPNVRRLKSLLTHLIYGIGLYVTGLLTLQI
jgi:hypothetical protein